ncbi:MAG TPA: hypothetical protein VMX17_09020 [Candidatus Glassbacteria bacterium]|nr:hypothetical protein [Candidatus Glassbacteria bacterium]
MSHFTVLVCVADENGSLNPRQLESQVVELMAPFQENNMEDCPQDYLEFISVQEDLEEDYANEDDDTKKNYPSLEEYAEKYNGYSCEDGEYGYWTNPNAKWDWYQIGGRWKGMFPVKTEDETMLGEPGVFGDPPEETFKNRADVTRIKNLDVDAIAKESIEAAERYWAKWVALKENKPLKDAQPGDNFFVTMRAHSLGLMDVKDSISEEEESRSKLREDSRYDVYSDITKSEFMERFISYFNPIQCYAALDENGWHAPGEVGFFGTSSDSPDEKIEFSNSFYQRFIKNKNPNDWLVVVDCHT